MKRHIKILLIAILEILLFSPAALNQRVDRGSKSIGEYWADTDLSSTELESLLDNKICFADRLSYLSCVNSIVTMAEKYNLYLTVGGELKSLTFAEISQRLSEKQELAAWAQSWDQGIAPKLNFIGLWKKLDAEFAKPRQRAGLIAAGINGYLSIAKDPHSYIIPLAFYEEVISRSESRQYQHGFIARRLKDYAIVRKIFENSPASKAGLKKGDKIRKINSRDVVSLLPGQFSELMKLNTEVRLSLLIERWEVDKNVKKYIEIIKSDYIAPSVASQLIQGGFNASRKLGLLTLHKFAKNTCVEAKQHLTNLIEQGISGVLLDLRDNPGGQVDEAGCVLNLFIEKGRTLFETRFSKSIYRAEKYFAEEAATYMGPLAVLVNSGSASSSEIVAGSLKDLGRAVLIGERTFGKGTFQDGRLWGAHKRIAIFETKGMYYFPSGWSPQLVGLEPDLKVQFADAADIREQALFFNPIIPKNAWYGPQTLTWLQLMQCQGPSNLWDDLNDRHLDDPQLVKAGEWLNCSGKVGSL